jgi:hypothetical protein
MGVSRTPDGQEKNFMHCEGVRDENIVLDGNSNPPSLSKDLILILAVEISQANKYFS